MSDPSTSSTNPEDLAHGLREGTASARLHFQGPLRPLLLKLFDRLTRDHGMAYTPEYLLTRALRLAEVYVRSRPVGAFQNSSWRAFFSEVLIHIAHILDQPLKQTATGKDSEPFTVPDCKYYRSHIFIRPFERVGKGFFGGDWVVGQHDDEGALWLLMADITGHGFTAYLLASALPLVWKMAWDKSGRSAQPADLLTTMHHQLESVLPDGIYVEATLLKLTQSGEIFLQAAGGSRLILRREGATQLDLLKYRGCWLGLMPPSSNDLQRLRLAPGDELVVGTDGLFDQIDGLRGQDLATLLASASPPRLLDWLKELVHESLEAGPQKDDITLLILQRRPTLPTPQGVTPPRAADVSM